MEHKKYIDPEMDVTMFEQEDVITTSGGNSNVDADNGIILPDDNWP